MSTISYYYGNFSYFTVKTETHRISARVWLYEGDSPWHFVTIEKPDADRLKADWPWPRRGFGAIPVHVTVGNTTWKTSVFPDKNGEYILPIKKAVRLQEKISAGSIVDLNLDVIA